MVVARVEPKPFLNGDVVGNVAPAIPVEPVCPHFGGFYEPADLLDFIIAPG